MDIANSSVEKPTDFWVSKISPFGVDLLVCLIIDASRLSNFAANPPTTDAMPIFNWLRKGGRIVYSNGGKFATEVSRAARRKLLDLSRQGRAILIPYESISIVVRELTNQIKSDDPHVMALAKVTGTRVLYTNDGDLMDDFRDRRFLNRPRGKVYSRAQNADILARSKCVR